jgi:hypothetical protein
MNPQVYLAKSQKYATLLLGVSIRSLYRNEQKGTVYADETGADIRVFAKSGS